MARRTASARNGLTTIVSCFIWWMVDGGWWMVKRNGLFHHPPPTIHHPLLVGVRRLPEILALGVLLGAHLQAWMRLDGAVPVDLTLTGQPHFVLAADAGEHPPEREALHAPRRTQVLRALLDQHLAGAAGAVPETIQVLRQARVDIDPGLFRLGAEIGAGGNLDFLVLVDKN